MADWSGCTAMVVEDSPVQRDHMAGLLRQAGFGEVLLACDGIDALRKLNARGVPVQLVLTDMDMPGMEGIELIRHICELELAASLLVASAREERLREAQASLAQRPARLALLGTALKPVHFEALADILERADMDQLCQASATGMPQAEEVRAGLEDGQFLPYYEPRIEIASGMLRGLDVLPCWMHPERGLIRAARFMPAVQGTDWIAPLTAAIAGQALHQLHAWHEIGLISLGVSIKLPAETLADRAQVDQLSALARELDLAPRTITWECPEPVLAGGAPLSIANLAHLAVRGFGLAVGGYRAGHTTQQQLARCPLTELRIDPVIVHEASQYPPRQALLQASVSAAQQMRMAAVAEGVELTEDLALLRGLGCEMAQGALVAAPMPGNALAAWIKNNRRRLKELASASAP